MKYYTETMAKFSNDLSVFAECRTTHIPVWECPPFLFLVLGVVTIISMLATYALASRYVNEPQIAALTVTFVAVTFLVLGNLIITGFARLAEANRMKAEFLSIVSHQLRSPLSIFKWTLEVIQRGEKTGDPPKDMENLLQTLVDTTERMIQLVNSLLEVSRIEAQTFVLHSDPFQILPLTESIIAGFKKYAEASDIMLTLNSPEALPDVSGDRDRIAMVIQNLIDNAIRYNKKAGAVSVHISKTGNSIRWEITDRGIGIPETEQKKIFQKFFRGNNASANQTHGSGIGLYIAKSIVQASGGTIGFRSKEGEGTTFWFTLRIIS